MTHSINQKPSPRILLHVITESLTISIIDNSGYTSKCTNQTVNPNSSWNWLKIWNKWSLTTHIKLTFEITWGSIAKIIMNGLFASENSTWTASNTNSTLSCSQLSRPSTIMTSLVCCCVKASRHLIYKMIHG